MKKLIAGLSVLLALGLILAGCAAVTSPDLVGRAGKAANSASGPVVTWNKAVDDAIAGDLTKLIQVDAHDSNRSNASADVIKISANANNDNGAGPAAGVYFRWVKGQKDSGVLKVAATVFDTYDCFTLTKKVSNSYWDYEIAQPKDDDGNVLPSIGGYYYYSVPDSTYIKFDGNFVNKTQKNVVDNPDAAKNNFNINMVFIWNFVGKNKTKEPSEIYGAPGDVTSYVITFNKQVFDANGKDITEDALKQDGSYFFFDLYDGDNKIDTQQADANGVVTFTVPENKSYTVKERIEGSTGTYVDPNGKDGFGILTVSPTIASRTISIISQEDVAGGTYKVDPDGYWICSGTDMSIAQYWNSLLRDAPDSFKSATWIWDRPDSWMWGATGSGIIHYTTTFTISSQEELDSIKAAPIAFACDNAAALFVNGNKVVLNPSTNASFVDGSGPNYGDRIDVTSNSIYVGDLNDQNTWTWRQVYTADMLSNLQVGDNSIVFYAANSDDLGGKMDITNNPCGLIFAGEINAQTTLPGNNNPFVNTVKPAENNWDKTATVSLQDGDNGTFTFTVSVNGTPKATTFTANGNVGTLTAPQASYSVKDSQGNTIKFYIQFLISGDPQGNGNNYGVVGAKVLSPSSVKINTISGSGDDQGNQNGQ